jgi:hypothetical protein
MPRRLAVVVAVAMMGAALLAGPSAVQAASGEPHYCLHGINSEGFILKHRNISLDAACRVVRKFVKWLGQDHHSATLSRCGPGVPGKPILLLHSFDGYRLSIPDGGGLVLSQGRSSFEIGGFSGWPTGCD